MRIIVSAALSAAAAGASGQSLHLLPHVPSTHPAPTIFGVATGVTFDGSRVVATCGTDGPYAAPAAFVWTQATGSSTLGPPAGFSYAAAVGVSADGAAVVGYAWGGTTQRRGVIWNQSGQTTVVPVLPGAVTGELVAVSADGSTALGYCSFASSPGVREYFRWTAAGGTQSMGVMPAGTGFVSLTGDGSVAVGSSGGRAVVWTEAAGLQQLPLAPGWTASSGGDITPDGRVVVGSAPFRWTAGLGSAALPLPAGWPGAQALGVSADGFVVVGTMGMGPSARSFVWTPALGSRDLQHLLESAGVPMPWQAMEVTGVSGDGRTVFGSLYATTSLPRQAFAARLRPEWVCYANCDGSTSAPALSISDFTCYLQRFAAGLSSADCDNSPTVPALNVADFTCFLQKFAAGCP